MNQIPRSAKEGCPQCEGAGISQFNWKRPSADVTACLPNLRFLEQLKSGKIFVCVRCEGEWYLDEDARDMSFIHPEQRGLVREWSRRKLAPDPGVFEQLKKIGAVPARVSPHRSFGPSLRIPCRCVFRDGSEADFCLVTFQQMPPLARETPYRFMDDAVSVSESSYALSREIRLAASRSAESGADLLPAYASAPGGGRFELPWGAEFFEKGDVRGCQLSLLKDADYPGPSREASGPAEEISRTVTVVIADWNPECESLRFPVPEYLEALGRYAAAGEALERLAGSAGFSKTEMVLIRMGARTPSKRGAKRILDCACGRRPPSFLGGIAGKWFKRKG